MFCPNCKSMMYPAGGGAMACRKCGYKTTDTKAEAEASKTRSLKDEKPRVVVDGEESVLPKTKNACPKCSNNEAYWMMQQTRKADEAPTRFYICTKCGYRWREYN